MVKRLILGVIAMGFLFGCGIGLEDSVGPDADRALKNEKLREEYRAIEGTYSGQLKLSAVNKSLPVTFYLFLGEVQEAPLPGDLRPGIRVVLRGRMIQASTMGDSDNLILTGQFDGVTGALRLDPDPAMSTTASGCRLGGQDPISVTGHVNGENLTATVLRNGQNWGVINVRRVSRDSTTGATLSEEEEFRRLVQLYEPVIGTYRGQFKREMCSSERLEGFSAWLYIERVQEGSGVNGAPCYRPRLALRTFREFQGELADVKYFSLNRFDPETFLPQFQSSVSRVEMSFSESPARLRGVISTTGKWAEFDVVRESKFVEAPDDETLLLRERLERTYRPYIGLYRGKVDAYTGPDWPVHLNLYMDEGLEHGVRVPILRALYTRRDLSDPSIGSRLMDVAVVLDGCRPNLIMKSEGNNNGPIPGIGLMRYSAEHNNGVLTGELIDHRGPQGILTVKK